jgi:hypothetical protein
VRLEHWAGSVMAAAKVKSGLHSDMMRARNQRPDCPSDLACAFVAALAYCTASVPNSSLERDGDWGAVVVPPGANAAAAATGSSSVTEKRQPRCSWERPLTHRLNRESNPSV